MLGRVFAIAMNTYREAVRARVLLGLVGLALVATAYSLVIAAMSLRQEMRIVADTGAFVISAGSIVVAVVLGATSLYRELELKTVFPILTRRLRRHEYLVGKYLGIVGTLVVFIAIDGATTLGILAVQSKQNVGATIGVGAALVAVLGLLLWRAKQSRVFVVLPWSLAAFAVMAFLAAGAGGERQVLLVSVVLTTAEVAIVTAVAMLFSSFSSPFLTALFTLMLVIIGRSADTLGNLPERIFTSVGRKAGMVVAAIVPNLNLYVPARPLMLGELPGVAVLGYVARAWANALLYAAVLLALSAIVFRKRDFQ